MQRHLAVGQVIGFQQPRQPQHVVGVEVREVDLVDLGQPQRALHLPLRPFAAVEQQPLPAARDQHAAVERRAEGTDAPVPRKVTARSIARAYATGASSPRRLSCSASARSSAG